MSHKPYKGFEPKWFEGEIPKDSYRSIFKWGDPNFIKVPKESLYGVVKKTFGMTDKDFDHYHSDIGLDCVQYDIPVTLDKKHIDKCNEIFGEQFVRTDDYARLSVSYGKTMYDLLRLRQKQIENIPDVVVYPDTREQIEQLVQHCAQHKIPMYVYGGGSSVTRGTECVKGGISLDMRLRYNKIIDFNDVDQTITVQTGMSGPRLEEVLNDALVQLKQYGASRAYTCGHFPQSFEYSSVGGWVVTRGAGQNSTYYGKIEDMVLCQKYATPIGNLVTSNYPREATGPSINHIMMGSEGAFGILTEVTLRVFRYMPQNRKRFSYMFKNWEVAMQAAREMMQCEAGNSSVFRLSDPEETSLMLRLYNVDDTPLNGLLDKLGYKDMNRCMFLGFTDGEIGFSKNVARNIHKIARKHHAITMGGWVTRSWEKGRFNDPYLRDSMQDFGVVTDTMECSVNWSNMGQVHKQVREYCKSRPNTICTTHMSHVYPQGANLYFIFIARMETLDEYVQYHSGILDSIQKVGAAMSHHHGIGKMFGPWLEGSLGKTEFGTVRVLKNYFDPDNIMNPGGTLGLDTEDSKKRFLLDIKR